MVYIIERILIIVVAVAVGAGVAASLVSIYGGGDGEADQAIGVPTPDATLEAWLESTEATLPAETPTAIPETTTIPVEAPTKTPRPLIPLPALGPTSEPAPDPTSEPASDPAILLNSEGWQILVKLLAEYTSAGGDLDSDLLASFISLAAELSDSPGT